MLKAAILCVALLSGCTVLPDCYVGIAVYPFGPFVHCGVGASPDEPPLEDDLDV